VTAVHADSLEGVSPAAAAGVAGVRDQFPGHTVTVTADDNGGVFVVVDDVPAGSPYREATTWLGFHINAAYPDSDVYPHFVGPLTRKDEQAHGEGFSGSSTVGRQPSGSCASARVTVSRGAPSHPQRRHHWSGSTTRQARTARSGSSRCPRTSRPSSSRRQNAVRSGRAKAASGTSRSSGWVA
jgi:hypothetical protein